MFNQGKSVARLSLLFPQAYDVTWHASVPAWLGYRLRCHQVCVFAATLQLTNMFSAFGAMESILKLKTSVRVSLRLQLPSWTSVRSAAYVVNRSSRRSALRLMGECIGHCLPYNLSARSTGLALLWFVKCFMHLSPFGGLLLHEICKRSCPTVTICLAPPSKWRFNLRFGILNTCICCCVVCWDWKMKFWLLVTSRSFYLFEMRLYAFLTCCWCRLRYDVSIRFTC